MSAVEAGLSEFVIRFLVGGCAVSVFALLGDLFKPKSFAGLFGSAPSVALASLGLAAGKNGPSFASTEARFMIIGAVALFVYTSLVSYFLARPRRKALTASLAAAPSWFLISFGLWLAFR
jgi:hypothetical protein